MGIYCDHNATAPVRPEVVDRMLPFLREAFGNASSVHAAGSRARCAVEEARASVAALVGATPAEITFTSGGTESNNLALFGLISPETSNCIVTTPIEHASIREPIAVLHERGVAVEQLAVDTWGRITAVSEHVLQPPAIFSVGWANNEVGTIQPIAQIAAACRQAGHLLHVDAVQAAGKIPVSVDGIDVLSLSGHKLGGPQGVGALFVRRAVTLRPQLLGGAQERGRRAGTENVPAIVGFGAACRLAAAELGGYMESCLAMREELWQRLTGGLAGVHRNSPLGTTCLPNTLNVSFGGVRGEALVAALDLDGVAVSSGSACAAGAGAPSHVLEAMGRSSDAARDGIRFSFGRGNTTEQVERIAALTIAAVARIRAVRGSGDDA